MNELNIINEIKRRIFTKKLEMNILSKSFSERDSLSIVWTKKNSKWSGIHSELTELTDLLRTITSNVQGASP